MLRVRTVFAGVPGTLWYSNFFFNAIGDAFNVSAVHTDTATFWSSIASRLGTPITWSVEGEVAEIDPATGDVQTIWATTPTAGVGSGGSDLLPPVCQGLIRLHTGQFVGGREIRGRCNVPGPVEFASEGAGTPTAAYVAALNSAATTLADSTQGWGVWSRKNGEIAEISTVSTWTKWAILTSRRD